jgi:uncharacterized protein Yka (UPF0111/DUF47 family)
MLLVSRKREKEFIEAVNEYMNTAVEVLNKFTVLADYIVTHGASDVHAEILNMELAEENANCRNFKRDIEELLYKKYYAPVIRDDMTRIVEKIFYISESCVTAADMIIDQKLDFLLPNKFLYREFFMEIKEHLRLTVKSLDELLSHNSYSLELASRIEAKHNQIIAIRRKLIRNIFSNEGLSGHPGGQLLRKESVMTISRIGAVCNKLSEEVVIAAIKLKA